MTFAGLAGVTPMPQAPWADSIYWLYTVLIDETVYGMDSRSLLRLLSERGVQSRSLWQPVHLSRAHAGSQAYHCDVAVRLNREGLSLPSSVGLTAQQQDEVIALLVRLRSSPNVG